MEKENINISITKNLWKELNTRKEAGESFDSLLKRMMLEVAPTKPRSKKK